MTKKETRFTNILRSRGVACILAAISAWMIWRCLPSLTAPAGWLGIFPELSCVLNFAVLTATGVAMIASTRSFTLLRPLSV
ncbi:MAG: hypothetical protein K2I24_07195, partial [Duncaniella sp.]|nr:hypothetical protein [Duncaniella sp.]